MSTDQLAICGKCGLPITASETGVRYFGTYTAHREYRCLELMRARAESSEQRLREVEADAARYVWLRDTGDATWKPMAARPGCSSELIDAAIDAAMKSGGQQ